MTTKTKPDELSDSAIVTHYPSYSEVCLLSCETDGMSEEDWSVDEERRFDDTSCENHKRRALGYAVENSKDDYDAVQIDNKARKSELRDEVAYAESPEEAAEALAEYLGYLELSPDEPTVEHHENRSDVIWEGGPFEWALDFTSGRQIGAAEMGKYSGPPSEFHLDRLFSSDYFEVDCKNSFVVSFYRR